MAQDRRIRNGRNERLRLSDLASSALNSLGMDGFCPQGAFSVEWVTATIQGGVLNSAEQRKKHRAVGEP